MEFALAKAADAFLEVIYPLNAFRVANVKKSVTMGLIFTQKWLNGLQVAIQRLAEVGHRQPR